MQPQDLWTNAKKHSSFNVDESDDDRITNEAGDVVNVESFHQLRAVSLDGFDTDIEKLSDLFRSFTLCDQAQDFTLSRAESRQQFFFRIRSAEVEESFESSLRRDIAFTADDSLDRLLEFSTGRTLRQEPCRSSA